MKTCLESGYFSSVEVAEKRDRRDIKPPSATRMRYSTGMQDHYIKYSVGG